VTGHSTSNVPVQRDRPYDLEMLRAMFEQAPGFIAILEGPSHVFTLTNAAYRRIIGRDLIGKPAAEAVPEAIGQGFIKRLDAAYRTGEPFIGEGLKFTVADEQGEMVEHYIDIIYQPVSDQNGAVVGIFVQGSDVTERVRSERALRQSQEEYRRLNDALILANNILSAVPVPTGI
jgi:PAS domain S-box-containing protein